MKRFASAALLPLLLTGCSLLQQVTEPTPAAAPVPVSLSTELASAEAALAATPQDSGLKEKVAGLRKRASSIEQEHIAKAEKLWAGQQPGAALAELDRGLVQLPDSSSLQRRRTYYAELLERRLELPRAEAKLVRGRYVADALRVERQIHTLAPGSNAGVLAALEQEQKALAVETMAIGQRALDRKVYGFARWAFNIAGDLGAKDAATLLAETSKREKQKPKKDQPVATIEPELSEQQVLERRRSSLKQTVQDAIGRRDLLAARLAVTELQQLFPTDPDLPRYQQTLKPMVKTQVDSLMADGSRRYRDGDIGGAISAWKQALALDPGNPELPALIERATRVQANLDSLRERK